MQRLTLTSFGLIWVTLFFTSFGQVFLKLGLSDGAILAGKTPLHTIANIIKAIFKPKTMFGFFLYVNGTFVWLFVLSKVPLSIAFPLFSMGYFLVVILSATILKERVDWRFAITGLVLISIGVSCIGLSSPKKPKQNATHSITHKLHSQASSNLQVGHGK